MAKTDLNLKDLKGYVLSPGNIFWKQKSGDLVPISYKADFLNLELIEKLSKADYSLLIEDQIDLHLQHEFVGLMKAHEAELLFKDKKEWKHQLVSLFSNQFTTNEVTQFELDQMAWIAFSKISREEAKAYIDLDINLFKRNLSVAASFALCAFLLGYYSDVFLKKLFTDTMKNLMSLEKSVLISDLKESLEKIRAQESLSEEDRSYLSRVYPEKTNWMAERYDGSGVHAINKKEMTDLELVLVAINRHYSYGRFDNASIFFEIKNASFHCEERVLAELKKNLVMRDNRTQLTA